MGRRVVRKGPREMNNKAEDAEAKLEPLERKLEAEKEALLRLVEKAGAIVNKKGLKEKKTDPDPPQEVTLPAEEWDAIQAASAVESATIPKQGSKETVDERRMRMRMAEELEAQEKEGQELIDFDHEEFRREWNAIWSRFYGSFEDTTTIPPMRFTYKAPPTDDIVYPQQTLQVFSAKVAETRGGLQWPLDVFGFIAIRDCVDYNRNIIFNRARDNCQTLTQEDQNLVLVGPTRAIVLGNMEPMTIEICLKVKGITESEDKGLSFLAVPFMCDDSYKSHMFNEAYTSKLSTLEFTLGRIVRSVEATIFIRIICGSWPDDFCGEFAAFTTDVCGKDTGCADNAASIDHEKIVLLDSKGEKVPVACDGKISLSRRVVSVGIKGELKVSAKAWKDDNVVMVKEEVFTPLKAGLSYGQLDIGFCAVEVNVAWSLISDSPVSVNCRPSGVVSC